MCHPRCLALIPAATKKSILEDSNHGIRHSQLLSIVHNFALYVLGVISIIIILPLHSFLPAIVNDLLCVQLSVVFSF